MGRQMAILKLLWRSCPFSVTIVAVWLLISCFSVIIANENGLPALIPYSSTTIDFANSGAVSPLEAQDVESAYYRHWLGTDELGRDVFAQLIYGSRTALLVGFFSVLISAFIGICLGMLAGFFGDHALKVSKTNALFVPLVLIPFTLYLIFVVPWSAIGFTPIGLLLLGLVLMIFLLAKFEQSKNREKKNVALDLIIGRMIETMDALPVLFIIISLSAIIRPSIFSVICIIGISNWAQIARYARSETLKIKQTAYLESARAIGMRKRAILMRHILPNALPTLGVALAFNVAAAILIEATLSFLGVGIGVEEASWGSMLAEARRSPFAWWIAVFPGLAIFAVVFACNQIAEALSD